ncbi:MAG: helix-turn-helix transcriptional regulator, partial [Pseudomonadales bacterium]|nr:helix-turn-helix transcriptional regulator [Pseudomonadales bacterium]
ELTRRENEVVSLLVTGASNQSIATQLSISVNTVIRHLTNIFGKLGVTSRSEAIAHVLTTSRHRITDNP